MAAVRGSRQPSTATSRSSGHVPLLSAAEAASLFDVAAATPPAVIGEEKGGETPYGAHWHCHEGQGALACVAAPPASSEAHGPRPGRPQMKLMKMAAASMAARGGALCFSSRRRMGGCCRARFLVVSCETRTADVVYSSLVLPQLAAKLLGPPTTFNAAKLKVEFAGESKTKQPPPFPRAYTLTHCDFTANLTLAVSGPMTSEQLRSWQSTLQRDDVVAEWKEVTGTGEMTLQVHCFVSGANLLQDLAAGFRYYVFSKELPLVLKAVVHGDSALFAERPELMEAKVWVHFHSSSRKYNRIECWGPLRDATKRNLLLELDGRLDQLQSAITKRRRRKWATPETIFNALLALLL